MDPDNPSLLSISLLGTLEGKPLGVRPSIPNQNEGIGNLRTVAFDLTAVILDPDLLAKATAEWIEEWPNTQDALRRAIAEHQVQREILREQNARKELLEARPSEYLRKVIFPDLASGLLQIERERPQNPLAFLAAHLLKKAQK